MNSMDDQYGIDAIFISEVPEHLKCMVCHLVLRKPMQIMKCGHRFCEGCFERIKGYSQHLNTELCCPIDRNAIQLNQVFKDTDMVRVIENMTVKCSNNEMGCRWTGVLKDLQLHEEECQHGEMEGDPSALIKELCKRVGKFEDAMTEKENDIAFLKYNLQELKKSFNGKVGETVLLKVKSIENEMNLIKDENQELRKQCDTKIEYLTFQNEILKNKVDLFGKQLMGPQTYQDKQEEIICIKSESEQLSNQVQFNKSLKLNSVMDSDVKNLKEEVLKANNEILTMKNHLGQSLNKKSIEINELFTRVATSEKAIEDNLKKLNGNIKKEAAGIKLMKGCQKDVDEAMKNIYNLENHVTNIENVMFSNTSNGSKDIVLHWKLQNYQYYFNLGEMVYSPIFYTQVKGYCFKLLVTWSGLEKENLGLGLKLCRGNNYDLLKPFNVQYSLEVFDNEANISSETVSLSVINANRDRYFTILPGENECKEGFGYPDFLTMPDLKNYVVNDMLSIRCTLKP